MFLSFKELRAQGFGLDVMEDGVNLYIDDVDPETSHEVRAGLIRACKALKFTDSEAEELFDSAERIQFASGLRRSLISEDRLTSEDRRE